VAITADGKPLPILRSLAAASPVAGGIAPFAMVLPLNTIRLGAA
jgi:hypothetical protein